MYTSKKHAWSYHDLLAKSMKYCAYQERCVFEMQKKLFEWGASKENIDKIIDTLLNEKFIDEQRFAEVYVRGKVNIKKWGKIKIKAALLQKKIDEQIIDKQLDTVKLEIYTSNFMDVFLKKLHELKDIESLQDKKGKVYRYMLSKGYEHEIIQKFIEKKLS